MIDLTKKYTCFGGCEVIAIFKCPVTENYPLLAIYKNCKGAIHQERFTVDGLHTIGTHNPLLDLIPAPKKRTITVWVNVYKNVYHVHNTEKKAKAWANDDALLVAVKLEKEIELPNLPETQDD